MPGSPSLDTTGGLAAVLDFALDERDRKNAAATVTFGLDRVTGWRVELALATFTFVFDSHELTGPVELLGSFAPAEGSWMWGWFTESVPDTVTAASFAVHQFGEEKGIDSLVHPLLTVSEGEADALAALAFAYSGADVFFRAPGESAVFYFAVSLSS